MAARPADAIAAETGRTVPHQIKPRRPGDPAYLVADPTAAREILNFRPAHSDLATIIRIAGPGIKRSIRERNRFRSQAGRRLPDPRWRTLRLL